MLKNTKELTLLEKCRSLVLGTQLHKLVKQKLFCLEEQQVILENMLLQVIYILFALCNLNGRNLMEQALLLHQELLTVLARLILYKW